MNKKIRFSKIMFLILTILSFAFLILYFGDKQAIVIISNNEIITQTKEQNRINNLPYSKTYFMCINESMEVSDIDLYDENIINVSLSDTGYKVKAINTGETRFYNKQEDKMYLISVSDLYEEAQMRDKDPLPCHQYTKEQAAYLDTVLQEKIYDAGYQTRAGALEAARFLTLQFKYKLLYFCENGRLDESTGHPYADGEGRYYHKGLYLSDDKLDDITISQQGPAIWGCDLYEVPEARDYYNGIDCSGFVTWALYNAGYNPGDIGGGYGIESEGFDCVDLGDAVYISDIDYSKVKAGDLIGFSGHIGMIIGVTDENVYVAQAYWENDLEVKKYTHEELENSMWDYIVLMDKYYKIDGNYTNMW